MVPLYLVNPVPPARVCDDCQHNADTVVVNRYRYVVRRTSFARHRLLGLHEAFPESQSALRLTVRRPPPTTDILSSVDSVPPFSATGIRLSYCA